MRYGGRLFYYGSRNYRSDPGGRIGLGGTAVGAKFASGIEIVSALAAYAELGWRNLLSTGGAKLNARCQRRFTMGAMVTSFHTILVFAGNQMY